MARLALLISLLPAVAAAAEWHHPLYLDGGGYWAARVRVVVRSDKDVPLEGEPVGVPVGPGQGEADLVGAEARAVRVCDESGREMLFAVHGPDGAAIVSGPISAGSTVVLPAECPAKASAAYYIYFDNPSAGLLPDFLEARLGLVNGDLEHGDGPAPTGWRHDEPDERHRAAWTNENPQSGGRCLKTVVAAGAEPTWISTRQHGIHVTGGAKYRMRAWVKAENVEGYAGWYIHVGNRRDSMLMAPTLRAGDGTFGWREVTAEFTAPADADRADLGTVLRGTGTAWFDNVKLERLEPGKVRVVAEKPDRPSIAASPDDPAWFQGPNEQARLADHRAVVRVANFSDQPARDALMSVDSGAIENRMRGRLNPGSLRVTWQGRPAGLARHGSGLLFEGNVAPWSVTTAHVYFSDDPAIAAGSGAGLESLVGGDRNLVENPGFEEGAGLPEGWTHTGVSPASGVAFETADPGREGLGRRCAKMHVPDGAPTGWRGWHQSVPVRPGGKYLLAAWVKCKDVRQGEVRVHAHCHTADGELSAHEPYRSVGSGISGTTVWTLLSGMVTMPEDTTSLAIHLTTDQSGTVWHDGVLAVEVVPGRIVRFEGRPMAGDEDVAAWPVPAVVKVFPDDPAPGRIGDARLNAAGNEREPLQLAFRSGRALKNVRVEVDPPVGPSGATLADLEVNVVGYVPIDYPTSYYRSEAPAWHRKVPHHAPGCDGWPGWWPDPLLPTETFDLEPNRTQPVWVTVSVPKDAPPGDYQGKVRLVGNGGPLAEVPFAVHVWDFTLPDRSRVAAIYDIRLGQEERWGKSLEEAYPAILDLMAEHRLCGDTIRPTPEFHVENGQVTADFTEYDKAAEHYFDELGLPFAYTPWTFYLFGWGHPPKTMFGERPYPGEPPYENADRSKLRPEYKRVYQTALRLFWDHLKEKGWQEKIVLYISDEPFDRYEHIRQQMQALCDMIHEVDPAIPIYSSTWKHVPDWDGYLDVWGIGHYGRVPPEKMAELRAAGDRIWFTTDGQMCTDTPYCAVERLLPHYCFRYGAQAYEFWGVGWLTYDPHRYGWHAYIHQTSEPGHSFWVRYPNGDGFLLYPGGPVGHDGPVRSVRFDQAREGVEDYEYLHLLARRMAQAKAAGRDVAAAEAALEAAAALVNIPNPGGRYSSRILPDPEAVYQVREGLAEAIEGLR